MSIHRLALAIALLAGGPAMALLAGGPAVAKPVCGTPEEIKAAQLRQFHYQLQVAALNCRGDDPSLPSKWSAYVHHHGGTLSDNAKVMTAYFARNGKGAAGFDRFNTVLTNRESVRVHETEGYCEINAPLFDKAATASPAQLHALAADIVGKPMDMPACTESAKTDKPADKKARKKVANAN